MKVLTEELRKELKNPFGKIVSGKELLDETIGSVLLVTVGDYCTSSFLELGRKPDITIYDFKTMREPISIGMRKKLEASFKTIKVANPQGTITEELVRAIENALKKRNGNIFIEGEDDLAALVVMANAPDGTILVYGMPSQGAVVVRIDDGKRKIARRIIEKMEERC